MKKMIICLMMIMTIICFAGCGESQKADAEDVKFLTASEYWYFYDEMTGEYEKMSFKEDFSFCWECECGEPVGDSELYELYDYDMETGVITLYNGYDANYMEMSVLDYSDYNLMLDIAGEIRNYTYNDSGISVQNAEKYFKNYNMYGCIVSADGEEAVVGPFDYDGDEEYPDNAMKTYKLAEDIVFYDLQITTHITDEEKTRDVTYEEMEQEEGLEFMQDGLGFIWLNADMEIEKITYYSDLEIME